MTDGPRHDPDYLGDGVYVAHDGDRLWLRANNASWHSATAEVGLEYAVLLKLFSYAAVRGLVRRPN